MAKIRNRYNQVPHLTPDTNGKVAKSQLDVINESQEVSPFPAGYRMALINRRARKHNKNKTGMIHKRRTALERSVKYFTGELKPVSWRANLTLSSHVVYMKDPLHINASSSRTYKVMRVDIKHRTNFKSPLLF